MAAAAHTPGGYDGVPQKVGKDFNQADKGTGIRRKATGGVVEHPDHFQVPDEQGGHYVVAKHGLGPATHQFLKSLCQGGAMSAGGDVDEPQDPADEQGNQSPKWASGGDIGGDASGAAAGDERQFASGGMMLAPGRTAVPGSGNFRQRSQSFADGGGPVVPETTALPTQDQSDFDATRNAPGYAAPPEPARIGDIKQADAALDQRDPSKSQLLTGPRLAGDTSQAAKEADMVGAGGVRDAETGGINVQNTSDAGTPPTQEGLFGAGTTQDASGVMPPAAGTQDPSAPNPFGTLQLPKTRVSALAGESADTREQRERAEGDTVRSAEDTSRTMDQRNAVLQEQQAHEEASHKVYQDTQQGLTQKMTDLNQDILNTKIDPEEYWSKRGVAGRISATIGLLLSGFGSGLARNGSPNLALKVIQENINREIDSQKDNLATKKGVLAEYHRQFGDSQMAEQAARLHYNTLVTSQLQVVANNSTSQQVKIRADQLVALSKMDASQKITDLANLQKQRYDNAYNNDSHNAFELALTEAKAGAAAQAAGARPREMQGSKIANLQATMTDLDDHGKLLDNATQGPFLGGMQLHNPYAENTKTAEANKHAVTEKIASALGGGVASDARIHQVQALVPGPEVPPATAKRMLAQAKLLLKTTLDEYRSQQAGVGFKVGPGPVR
jgi:hypothetical protein